MANTYVEVQNPAGGKLKLLLADNGDGTYSLAAQQAVLGPNDHVDLGTIGGLAPMRSTAAITSAARTATTATGAISNQSNRGLYLVMQVTVASGTGGLQPVIQAPVDLAQTAWVDLHAKPTAVTTTGSGATSKLYFFHPTAPTSAAPFSGTAVISLPDTFRVAVYAGDASSYTYSVYLWLVN